MTLILWAKQKELLWSGKHQRCLLLKQTKRELFQDLFFTRLDKKIYWPPWTYLRTRELVGIVAIFKRKKINNWEPNVRSQWIDVDIKHGMATIFTNNVEVYNLITWLTQISPMFHF